MTTAAASTVFPASTVFVHRELRAPERESMSLHEIFQRYIKEKPADIAKAIGYSAFWSRLTLPQLPDSLSVLNVEMGFVKDVLGSIEIPGKLRDLVVGVSALMRNRSLSALHHVCLETLPPLTNSVADLTKVVARYAPIAPVFLGKVQAASGLATFVGSLAKIYDEVTTLRALYRGEFRAEMEYGEDDEVQVSQEVRLHLVKLACAVAYLGVGILSLQAAISGVPPEPVQIVGCLTAGLITSTVSYVYEKYAGLASTPPSIVFRAGYRA